MWNSVSRPGGRETQQCQSGL